MTTRPNAVDKNLKSKFGIMIENLGLDVDGIDEYLTKYFSEDLENKNRIKKFFNKNPTV